MTQVEAVVNVLLFFVSLAVLYELLLFLLKHRLEVFRQRLFSLRNALFDFAAVGGISFTNPVYRATRKRINSLIRFGHNVNSLHALLVWYDCRRDPLFRKDLLELNEQLHAELEKLPRPARDRIQSTYEQMDKILADYLLLRVFISRIYRAVHLRKPMNQCADYDNMRPVIHEAAVVESADQEPWKVPRRRSSRDLIPVG